ncbi:MAG: FAD-dependent monooxygenase [Acetobacteraceae bacterium]|nr:FAD-dependent monooxygenase [Acetobacteraceae bacterium]
MKPRVLIAGAGLCGLTTAFALQQRGFDVRVFEQAAELREVGAGIQLGANGTRVLISLGLEDAMRRIVCEPEGKEIRLWTTGQTWTVFDLGARSVTQYGAPYWMAHRGDFHRVLLDAVRSVAPDSVTAGAACVGFEQSSDAVILHLANGEHFTGDVLLGADGVHSIIRRQMFGDGSARFTGILAWRGLVPMECLPPHMRRLVGTNWVGHGGHVVTYPLRRGEILNFVGAVERDDWIVESWTEAGTREECAHDLRRWHEDVQSIIRNIEIPYKWALLGRDPLDHFAQGRVCLLGDAAHPTLPFLAQGANMALEDAVIVARCLDAFPVQEALRRFALARVERTAAIVRGSSENAGRFHNPALADPEQAERYVDREFQPDKMRQRYDWLYEYDALNVRL